MLGGVVWVADLIAIFASWFFSDYCLNVVK